MSKLTSHPEFAIAARQFIRDMDVPAQLQMALTPLIVCSLARVSFKFWLEQDARDPEWVADPDDGIDPMWFRIDGWPERGGSAEEILARKWSERVQLFRRWYGVDVWHVIDWLTVAEGQDHSWLYRLDADGYPVKLTKCGDLDRLVVEATKGLRDRNAKTGGEIILPAGSEEQVVDLGAGFSLVQLHTPTALRREGVRMHNCLRHGDYGRRLIDQAFRYFSVRGPGDIPHGTIEMHLDRAMQFAGPCNVAPAPPVFDLVSGVADGLGWQGLADAIKGLPEHAADEADEEAPAAPAPENRRRF